MIGGGKSGARAAVTILGPAAGAGRDRDRASSGPEPPRPTAASSNGRCVGLYGLGLFAVVLYFCAVGSGHVRVRQAARAQLAEAGDRAGGALAGALGRRPRGPSCWSSCRTPRSRARPRLELGRIRSAMFAGLRHGRRAGVRVHGDVRRVGAQREGRPGLLPHHPAGRGHPQDRPQPGPADRGRDLLPGRERRPRGGRQLHDRPGQGVGRS